MSSALVLLIVFLGSAWALGNPVVGVLLWTWISIMNPHRLTWGAAVDFPVAMVVAAATLSGFLFFKNKRFFLATPQVLMMAFMLWVCITNLFAFYPEGSGEMLSKVMKIDLMILVALALLHSKQHIIWLTWVLVISIGFYGVKGGFFTLTTGGNFRVWGPMGSYIEGNNEVALAMIVIIPLMYFLRELATKTWQKHVWLIVMGLSAIGAIGSQSRGALLAIAAMAGLLWLRGRQKVLLGAGIVLFSLALVAFMPESWHSRMDTIQTYEQDASAMGRINAWWMAWNLACNNFFGGGFEIYNQYLFQLYAPDPKDIHAAHSIYFQVLGEHGFIGLAIFLAIWIWTWRWASWIRKHAAGDKETEWAGALATMCQVSLLGYAVGGAFLSLAYFDLPYNLMVLVVLTRRWLEERMTMQGLGTGRDRLTQRGNKKRMGIAT